MGGKGGPTLLIAATAELHCCVRAEEEKVLGPAAPGWGGQHSGGGREGGGTAEVSNLNRRGSDGLRPVRDLFNSFILGSVVTQYRCVELQLILLVSND